MLGVKLKVKEQFLLGREEGVGGREQFLHDTGDGGEGEGFLRDFIN